MSANKPVLVGMDCGSGNVATVMERDGKMQIRLTPSYVRYVPGSDYATEESNVWVTAGANGADETYVVLSKAVGSIDTRTPDYQLSAACRVLVTNALSELGLAGKRVIIADTLPANQYYDDNNAVNRAKIQLKRESLLTTVRNANKAFSPANMIDVRIMPEAVTAYNAALYREDGVIEGRLDGARDVVIVDIGRYTIDFAHLECENTSLYARETTSNGVHTLLTMVKQEMVNQASSIGISADKVRVMTLDDIDAILRLGYYGSPVEALKDKRVYLDDLIAKVASTYASEIQYKLKTIVPSLDTVDALVIVGGGAYYIGGMLRKLQSFVKDWHANVIIPHQPETAVARGAYLALSASLEESE